MFVIDRSSNTRGVRKAKRSKRANEANKEKAELSESQSISTPISPSMEPSQQETFVEAKQSAPEMNHGIPETYEDITTDFREYQAPPQFQPPTINDQFVSSSADTYPELNNTSAVLDDLPQQQSPSLYLRREAYHQRTCDQFQSGEPLVQAQSAMWSSFTPQQLQSMEHYPTSVPPELCQPGLYEGQPSQPPRIHSLSAESTIFDHSAHQGLQNDNGQCMAQGLFMVDHQHFPRNKDMRQPRSLPFRSLTANQYSLMDPTEHPMIMAQEPFYHFPNS